MSGYVTNVEAKSIENPYFREVLFTAPNSQLVLMSLNPGEDIGMETHQDVDQFFRVEAGQGKALLDGREYVLADGSAVVVPAGTEHNILNTSTTDALKLYTIYSPPQHPAGTVHRTKADAIASEKAEEPGKEMEEMAGGDGKIKTRTDLSRYDAAQRIQAIAEQLRLGEVAVGDRFQTVPEQVRLVLEAEKDELEIEVKWKAAREEEPVLDEGVFLSGV